MPAPRPYNLIAELTYRCPLRCVYCSNPIAYDEVRDALSADDWGRIFREAAALGCVHVGLTGGEPTARRDIEAIVAHASAAGLYSHLVTAGIPIAEDGLDALVAAGLRSVQLSIQDSRAEESERIAGTQSFERKLGFARAVRAHSLPLVLNVVLHRHNLARVDEIVALARELDAERLELANAQYHGWGLRNRAALLPSRQQLESASQAVQAARRRHPRPEIEFVLPDYFRGRPKPCMGGWGRKAIVVTPEGAVLPCHAAAELPNLEFWNANEAPLAACWSDAPGMNAYRGEAWMPEPCRSCPERARDFAGCRCQAFALTGDAAVTDPACELAPDHERIASALALADPGEAFSYRGPRAR